MAQEKNDKPKIIVDDDWKAQAQAEKEQLAEESQKQADGASDKSASGDEKPPGRGGQIPQASFAALVNSIAMQTMLALGGVEDPKTKKRYVDLDVAKFHIDTLTVLQEKTKGNLTEEENKLLDRALYDLRMGYVQISQHTAGQKEPKNDEK